MFITRRLACALLLLAVAAPVGAQTTASAPIDKAVDKAVEQAIRAPIDMLFNGMKARDTMMVISAFTANGRLVDIRDRNGQTTVGSTAPADFARGLLRAPAGQALVERYWDLEIKVEGNVANAWAKYDFHVGDRFTHCGIDAFQLAKTHEGWKIVQIMDTRQQTGCTAPPAK